MYTDHFQTKRTPQTQPIPLKPMVPNSAGGYSFKVDPIARATRFLILGSEGGTYYASEKKLTVENAQTIVDLIKSPEGGALVVGLILGVSQAGRAAKQEPAIFSLALCCAFGDQTTKNYAYDAVSRVCRTGTQIFTFCQYVQDLRGWSRGLRKAVAKFYTEKTPEKVGYQLMKYRQRNGWTHRDVLRLCHPKAKAPHMFEHNELFKWAVGKRIVPSTKLPLQFQSYLDLQRVTDPKIAAHYVRDHKLPREALPTEMLKHKIIWEALLEDMPMQALVRNLGVMTANGVLTSNFDENTKRVVEMLGNGDVIEKSKLHPYAVLLALKTYSTGHGMKGKLSWTPVPKIVAALDEAFYKAFRNAQPTGKNVLIGLDVSGSMDGSKIHNSTISAREASAAMALVTARTEPNHQIMAFSNQFMRLNIDPRSRLEDVCRVTAQLPLQGTDCSLPMTWAMQMRLPIDTFIIYTDSETYQGRIHPKQALDQFRQSMGREAKCIVVGMTSNGFTIADPEDSGMLDIVGFDTAAPALIQDFISKGV